MATAVYQPVGMAAALCLSTGLVKADEDKTSRRIPAGTLLQIRLRQPVSSYILTLCYVDRHDEAYQWVERRRFEVHPENDAGLGWPSGSGAVLTPIRRNSHRARKAG